MNIENLFFNLYKSISPDALKAVIPLIDSVRKFKNKPPIPLKEKMAETDYPDFSQDKVIMVHGVSVGEVMSLENLLKEIKNQFPITISKSTMISTIRSNTIYIYLKNFTTI